MTSNKLTNDLLLALSKEFKAVAYRHNVVRAQVANRWIRSSPDGVSDIVGSVKGRFLAIEVKVGKDTLSEAQYGFLESVWKSGGIALVCGRKSLKRIPFFVPCLETVEAAMLAIDNRLNGYCNHDGSVVEVEVYVDHSDPRLHG